MGFVVVSAGCGGGSAGGGGAEDGTGGSAGAPSSGDVQCGRGTTLEDGVCVAEPSAPTACGEGTELVSGECVPSSGDVQCGQGTTLEDGECVAEPSTPTACGEGTELQGDVCVAVCADEGEVLVDGACRLECDVEGEPFGGGEGTRSAPYRICTAEHLAAVNEHLDKNFLLTRHLDLADVEGFEPLGGADDGQGFSGRFDGAGLTLRNLEILMLGEEDHVGLFRRIEAAGRVEDLGLIDVTVSGRDSVGGLVGHHRGHIMASYVTGAVTGIEMVGGLVGENRGDITASYATGTVSGFSEVGGLVGHHRDHIMASYATGTVSGFGDVGGLVGRNRGDIAASYARGAVSGDEVVGGLVGRNVNESSNVTASYATGAVTGGEVVGGLVGFSLDGNITASYAAGAVTGDEVVGGLVGDSDGSVIEHSYFLHPDEGGGPDNELGAPLTVEGFGEPESFEEWDFDDTWVMQTFDAPDFTRPTLRDTPEG